MQVTSFTQYLRRGLLRWWQAICVVVFCGVIFGGLIFLAVLQAVTPNFVAFQDSFQVSAGRSPLSIGSEVAAGFVFGEPIRETRWLILGTDEVDGSGRDAILTDTIMVATYRPQQGSVHLLSIPRDIYLVEYGEKINLLYQVALEQNPRAPTLFVREAVSTMLGQPIDGVVVVRLRDVEQLVDVVGGVTVDVPRTFEDFQYPRSGVDVSVETDPAVLFETLKFEQGPLQLDGELAIKYMRTRKSLDPIEGTDDARNRRQQQVIAAVAHKLQDPHVIGNPAVLGRLYRIYAESYAVNVSAYTLGMLIRAMGDSRQVPEITSVHLTVTDLPVAPSDETLFVHPPDSKYGQWSYEPVDPTWQQLREFLRASGL